MCFKKMHDCPNIKMQKNFLAVSSPKLAQRPQLLNINGSSLSYTLPSLAYIDPPLKCTYECW